MDLFPNEKIDYGGYFKVHPATLREWSAIYSPLAVDVELLHMVEWLKANPRKAKKKLWQKFITGWLKREHAKVERAAIEARRHTTVGKYDPTGSQRAAYSANDIAYYNKMFAEHPDLRPADWKF